MIPVGLTFKQALQKGYIKPYRNKAYLEWVKSCPCWVCGAPADDAHHVIGIGLGGMGTKAPDTMAIPLCRAHHEKIHNPKTWDDLALLGTQWEAVAYTLLQAVEDGVISL